MSDTNQACEGADAHLQEVVVIKDESSNSPSIDRLLSEEQDASLLDIVNSGPCIVEQNPRDEPPEDEVESKESSRIVQDAEIPDDNDSEYEDVDDEGHAAADINRRRVSTSLAEIQLPQVLVDDESELHEKIQPRALKTKCSDDEHSEGDKDEEEEESDNQNVPDAKPSEEKPVRSFDDDNDKRNPAYIPRRGKFYEHDDRTIDEHEQSRSEISQHRHASSKESDGKWQHDLYLQDEQGSKPRFPSSRQNTTRPGQSGPPHRPSPLRSNDYSARSFQKPSPDYHSPRHHQDSTRPVTHARTPQSHPQDGNRSVSFDAHRRQPTERHAIDEHTFHRERSFINRQFQQQQRAIPRENDNRYDPRRPKEDSRSLNDYQGDRTPKPYPGTSDANSKQSNDRETLDRPRRYSNMRSNAYNTSQQQVLASSKPPLNDRSSTLYERSDWRQTSPPPAPAASQPSVTSQLNHRQRPDNVNRSYPQVSRYIPMAYSSASAGKHTQANK